MPRRPRVDSYRSEIFSREPHACLAASSNYCAVPVVDLFSEGGGSRPLRGAGASVDTVGAGAAAGLEAAGCGASSLRKKSNSISARDWPLASTTLFSVIAATL
jgi:hypothetical protein